MLIAILKNLVVIPALTLLTVNLLYFAYCIPSFTDGGPDGFDLVEWLGLGFIALVTVILLAALTIDKAIETRALARMMLPRLSRMLVHDQASERSTYRGVWLERRVDRCCRTLGVVAMAPANDNRFRPGRLQRRPARRLRRRSA